MATIVGLVHLDLYVAEATSLKDKRRVVKSFKDRLSHRHNVSVAEVGDQDNHRRAVLAVAMVANDRRYVEGGTCASWSMRSTGFGGRWRRAVRSGAGCSRRPHYPAGPKSPTETT